MQELQGEESDKINWDDPFVIEEPSQLMDFDELQFDHEYYLSVYTHYLNWVIKDFEDNQWNEFHYLSDHYVDEELEHEEKEVTRRINEMKQKIDIELSVLSQLFRINNHKKTALIYALFFLWFFSHGYSLFKGLG